MPRPKTQSFPRRRRWRYCLSIALDFAASRSRPDVSTLRMALVLRLHIRTDRNDLEAVGPRVGDHMLHQSCSSAGTAHALRRVRVFSADERGSENGEYNLCLAVSTRNAGQIATSFLETYVRCHVRLPRMVAPDGLELSPDGQHSKIRLLRVLPSLPLSRQRTSPLHTGWPPSVMPTVNTSCPSQSWARLPASHHRG